MDQCDGLDAAFDGLNYDPSNPVPKVMTSMLACDPKQLRDFTTGTLLTGLAHTVYNLGDTNSQQAQKTPGVDLQRVEMVLSRFGHQSIRATFVRETGVASRGSQRRQQHQWKRQAILGEPPAQRQHGPPPSTPPPPMTWPW